jgi:hypothetical protein
MRKASLSGAAGRTCLEQALESCWETVVKRLLFGYRRPWYSEIPKLEGDTMDKRGYFDTGPQPHVACSAVNMVYFMIIYCPTYHGADHGQQTTSPHL